MPHFRIAGARIRVDSCSTGRGSGVVRALLGANAVTITLGYRGPALSCAVGGVLNSDYLTGRATDFGCSMCGAPREVARRIAASDLPFDQFINEFDRLVHVSVAADVVKPRRRVITARSLSVRSIRRACRRRRKRCS
ncbi:hypothetical protein CFB46_13365 [Burkholderia sp. HI2761]|nr:hypothetical protein CFB46_13365 [Burkholderia sp. HI2761]